MSVCVVSDRGPLGERIRKALVGSGRECPASQVVRADEAEPLLRARPGLVVFATGPDPTAALPTVARLGALAPAGLVAVGPLAEPKVILSVLRGGAADFVDEADLEAELPAALARLDVAGPGRTGTGRAAPGRIVAVVAPSGGSGSSLIAANLGVAFVKAHRRTLLIDLKARAGDLAALLDLKPSHSLKDLGADPARIDRVLFEQTLTPHDSGVHLLASPREFRPQSPASPEAIARVLGLARDTFPRAILDVDPALGPEQLAALRLADIVLVVMRLEFNPLRNAKPLIEHLERERIDLKRLALVGNRQGQPKELAPAKVEEALGRKFAHLLPDDPKAAIRAQNNGVPVMFESPSSRLARGLAKLATVLDALPALPTPKGS